jgi:hypothetical protein
MTGFRTHAALYNDIWMNYEGEWVDCGEGDMVAVNSCRLAAGRICTFLTVASVFFLR